MKKLSVISGIVLTALIVFAVISANSGNAANQPTLNQIKVYVGGCDDCRNITYCIDGGPAITVTSSPFVAEYDATMISHTICVHCCGVRAGTSTFTTGDQKTKVVVSQMGGDCQCSDGKKK
jgi:hypothetical protein